MASQPQAPAGELPGHIPHVLHRHFLGRDLGQTGQEKILLPAGQGVVRSPEGQVQKPVPRLHGQRRELLRLFRVQPTDKAVELHVPEAVGIRHFPQHVRNGVRHQDAHFDLLPRGNSFKKGLRRLVERHALPLSRGGNDAGEVHKGQLRQNEIVHLVEGGLLQCQVSPPVQIIQ